MQQTKIVIFLLLIYGQIVSLPHLFWACATVTLSPSIPRCKPHVSTSPMPLVCLILSRIYHAEKLPKTNLVFIIADAKGTCPPCDSKQLIQDEQQCILLLSAAVIWHSTMMRLIQPADVQNAYADYDMEIEHAFPSPGISTFFIICSNLSNTLSEHFQSN